MRLSCPYCDFARDLDPARIPPKTRRVTCPRCGGKFPFDPPAAPEEAAAPLTEMAPAPAAPTGVAAGEIPVVAPMVAAAALPKAGFWIRLVAALVDSLLVTAVQFVLGLIFVFTVAALSHPLGREGEFVTGGISWLFGTVLATAYYVFFTGYCGQTPGKMAVRVRVIRTDGEPIGYGKAFLRETLGKFLSALILGIGYLMIAFDAQKQGLHDKIADSYVIKL